MGYMDTVHEGRANNRIWPQPGDIEIQTMDMPIEADMLVFAGGRIVALASRRLDTIQRHRYMEQVRAYLAASPTFAGTLLARDGRVVVTTDLPADESAGRSEAEAEGRHELGATVSAPASV